MRTEIGGARPSAVVSAPTVGRVSIEGRSNGAVSSINRKALGETMPLRGHGKDSGGLTNPHVGIFGNKDMQPFRFGAPQVESRALESVDLIDLSTKSPTPREESKQAFRVIESPVNETAIQSQAPIEQVNQQLAEYAYPIEIRRVTQPQSRIEKANRPALKTDEQTQSEHQVKIIDLQPAIRKKDAMREISSRQSETGTTLPFPTDQIRRTQEILSLTKLREQLLQLRAVDAYVASGLAANPQEADGLIAMYLDKLDTIQASTAPLRPKKSENVDTGKIVILTEREKEEQIRQVIGRVEIHNGGMNDAQRILSKLGIHVSVDQIYTVAGVQTSTQEQGIKTQGAKRSKERVIKREKENPQRKGLVVGLALELRRDEREERRRFVVDKFATDARKALGLIAVTKSRLRQFFFNDGQNIVIHGREIAQFVASSLNGNIISEAVKSLNLPDDGSIKPWIARLNQMQEINPADAPTEVEKTVDQTPPIALAVSGDIAKPADILRVIIGLDKNEDQNSLQNAA